MAIIYPVDTNTRWSIWSISEATIKRHNKPWPRADGTEIVGLDDDLVPLLEVQEEQPAFDPETHYLERADAVIDVDANTHTHGWNIVARSQEDLDAEAELEQAKAVYQDLVNGAGTQSQRLMRTEKVCAYLLKNLFGAG